MAGVDEPRRMQLTGLHHLTAICANLDRTTAFYRDVLGLELVRPGPLDGLLEAGPTVVHPAGEDLARPERRRRVSIDGPVADEASEAARILGVGHRFVESPIEHVRRG